MMCMMYDVTNTFIIQLEQKSLKRVNAGIWYLVFAGMRRKFRLQAGDVKRRQKHFLLKHC